MFTKGQIVTPSGAGRTATWPKRPGTVLKVTKTAVFVNWQGTSFSDQMTPSELS